jgi:hypothetical protein
MARRITLLSLGHFKGYLNREEGLSGAGSYFKYKKKMDTNK